MIVLGVILLLIYYFAVHLYALWAIGWILVILGLVLLVLARTGHGVGGRYWY